MKCKLLLCVEFRKGTFEFFYIFFRHLRLYEHLRRSLSFIENVGNQISFHLWNRCSETERNIEVYRYFNLNLEELASFLEAFGILIQKYLALFLNFCMDYFFKMKKKHSKLIMTQNVQILCMTKWQENYSRINGFKRAAIIHFSDAFPLCTLQNWCSWSSTLSLS